MHHFLQRLLVVRAPHLSGLGVVALGQRQRLAGGQRPVDGELLGEQRHQPLGVGNEFGIAVPETAVGDPLRAASGERLRPVDGVGGQTKFDVGHAETTVASHAEEQSLGEAVVRRQVRQCEQVVLRPRRVLSGRQGTIVVEVGVDRCNLGVGHHECVREVRAGPRFADQPVRRETMRGQRVADGLRTVGQEVVAGDERRARGGRIELTVVQRERVERLDDVGFRLDEAPHCEFGHEQFAAAERNAACGRIGIVGLDVAAGQAAHQAIVAGETLGVVRLVGGRRAIGNTEEWQCRIVADEHEVPQRRGGCVHRVDRCAELPSDVIGGVG